MFRLWFNNDLQVVIATKERIKLTVLYYIEDYKQLLDEVFVISRIIKVEVRVISQSRRLRLVAPI